MKHMLGAIFRKAAVIVEADHRRPHPVWHMIPNGPLAGYEMYLDPRHDWTGGHARGHYDDFIFEAVHNYDLVHPGDCIWDVGAYYGYYSLFFASLAGTDGQVIAFEPNPVNFDYLAANVKRNSKISSQIRLMDCAVADCDGKLEFRYSTKLAYTSMGFLPKSGVPSDQIAGSVYRGFSAIQVNVSRIDSLIDQGLPKPSLIKLDVEGAESSVLQGALGLFAHAKPTMLIEVHSITNMFFVQATLLAAGYRTQLLEGPDTQSNSRAFLLAMPRIE
jgi:FkbM family methyltransferase